MPKQRAYKLKNSKLRALHQAKFITFGLKFIRLQWQKFSVNKNYI